MLEIHLEQTSTNQMAELGDTDAGLSWRGVIAVVRCYELFPQKSIVLVFAHCLEILNKVLCLTTTWDVFCICEMAYNAAPYSEDSLYSLIWDILRWYNSFVYKPVSLIQRGIWRTLENFQIQYILVAFRYILHWNWF